MNQNNKIKDINPALIVGWVFSGVGLILIAVGTILIWSDRSEAAREQVVDGKVITLNYNGSSSAPVVEFRVNGQRHRIEGTVWSTPPAFEVGEAVRVRITDGNTRTARIDSWMERYFVIVLLAFLAIVFGGIGGALLYFFNK